MVINMDLRKTFTVTVGSFVFLLVCSSVAYFTNGFIVSVSRLDNILILLGIGVGILLVSGITAAFIGENIPLNIICSLLSAIALGFCICAWHTLRGLENDFYVLVLVSLAAAGYLWIYFLLSKISIFEEHLIMYTVLFLLLSIGAYIPIVLLTRTTFLSTFGYYMLIELAFVYAVFSNSGGSRSLLRDFTLSTYSVFGVAVIVAVAAVLCLAGGGGDCDCDCSDCCDCCDCAGSHDKKKRKRHKM